MRFSNSFLDELRERVPISDVIGRHVTWDRKKTNAPRGDYWACCPFHGEKSPSFHCEDKKGRYYCFGCGVKGDHFKFLSEIEGLSFAESVERLADQAGMPLPAPNPEAARQEKKRATLEEVMEMAVTFFQSQLQSSDGAKARAYLRDRGLSGRTIETFRLGFAQNSRNGLKQHLASLGVEKDLIEACGLVVHGPDIAVSYDRFRDRIMFPIMSARERPIAFGGRAMDPNALAKYLNSNDTELFHKGNVLFNYARARKTIRSDEMPLIAVEGYMDVIALYQAGIENAVAPLGTALTENQLKLLWRVSSHPVLCFDGDGAGQRAANRAIDLALPHLVPGKSLRFAMLPEGKDPDDLVRDDGRQAFDQIIERAQPLAQAIWSRESSAGVFETPETRAELEKRLNQLVMQISDENVRRHYQQDVRNRLRGFFGGYQGSASNGSGASARGRFASGQKGAVYSNAGNFGAGNFGQISVAASQQLAQSGLVRGGLDRPKLREAALVFTIVSHPHMLVDEFDTLEEVELEHRDLVQLLQVMQSASVSHGRMTREDMVETLHNAGVMPIVERLEKQMRQVRLWQVMADAAPEDAREGFMQALALHQRTRSLKQQLNEIERDIAQATESGDADAIPDLMGALQQVQMEVLRLESQEAIIDGFGVLSGRGQKKAK